MECENVNKYICRLCGYETTVLPINFPKCPVCEDGTSDVIYDNNTRNYNA